MPALLARRRALAGVVTALVWTSACATQPPAAPPLEVEVRHYAGTVLTGPSAELAANDVAGGAWALELSVALVARAGAGEALVPRLVVVEGVEEPFGTRSELALGARRARTGPDDGVLWETRRLEAVLRGATTVLALEPNVQAPDAPAPPWERLELELSRRADDPQQSELALVLSGWVQPRAPQGPRVEGEPAAPELPRRSVRERLLLQGAPVPGRGPLVLSFPAPLPGRPEAALIVALAASFPAGSDALAEAILRARADIEGSRDAIASGAAGLSSAESFRIQSASALNALARRDLGRPAMLYLAGATGAELLGELALVAEVETLADLLQEAREHIAALRTESIDVEGLAWLLESTAWRWLAGQAARGEGSSRLSPEVTTLLVRETGAVGREPDPSSAGLTPELSALLLRAAGEAARWPDLLLEAVEESEDLAALSARLERENRIFLEDADPAARVRAFDWLEARGRAPEGFDPLASSEERRAVLARLQEQALEAAGDEEQEP